MNISLTEILIFTGLGIVILLWIVNLVKWNSYRPPTKTSQNYDASPRTQRLSDQNDSVIKSISSQQPTKSSPIQVTKSTSYQQKTKTVPTYDTGPATRQITDIDDIEVTAEFSKAVDLIENKRASIFLTGKAGTGKSTFLRYLKAISDRSFVVLAPTGLAAVNVGGQTIHSFFKFPPSFIETESIGQSRNADVMRKMEFLIIDEASMIRADLMDGIDMSLRLNRNSDRPFGGVQIVLIGDLYQLAPIVKEYQLKKYFEEVHKGEYFFCAHIFRDYRIHKMELTKVFRQRTDEAFMTLLNALRSGNITNSQLSTLNSRVCSENDLSAITNLVTLTATNAVANERNETKLGKLNGRLFEYSAQIGGKFPDNAYPTEPILRLKTGAQVMMLKNDAQGRWVNGTIYKISKLQQDIVSVEINGEHHIVNRDKWENIEYIYDTEKGKISKNVIGTFDQFPLKLAWAITIHKSQGQSFDNIYVD